MLTAAFAGELSQSRETIATQATSAKRPTPTDIHAGILSLAYRAHDTAGKLHTFGHVKAEKIAHMVEAVAGVDLGRQPVKDAAGPNDFQHLKKVEHRARMANIFTVKRLTNRYQFQPLDGLDALIERVQPYLEEKAIERVINLMVPMDTKQAEIFATTYAAWNNLLLDGRSPTDDEIVREAREDWHEEKLNIDREKFFRAIEYLRDKEIVPTGTGQRVEAKKPAKRSSKAGA